MPKYSDRRVYIANLFAPVREALADQERATHKLTKGVGGIEAESWPQIDGQLTRLQRLFREARTRTRITSSGSASSNRENWHLNGHHALSCACGQGEVLRRAEQNAAGEAVWHLKGSCPNCGPVSLTTGDCLSATHSPYDKRPFLAPLLEIADRPALEMRPQRDALLERPGTKLAVTQQIPVDARGLRFHEPLRQAFQQSSTFLLCTRTLRDRLGTGNRELRGCGAQCPCKLGSSVTWMRE